MFGEIPKNLTFQFWILDDILIQNGYSLSDIEMMSYERYEFLIQLLINKDKKKTFEGF